jgi:vitamin B12 transporter
MRKLHSRWLLAALFQAALSVSAVYAQSTPVDAPLSEIVVTAARMPQALADLVADVTVIDRAQIERSGAAALGDVLARLPGFEISRNGGPGVAFRLPATGGGLVLDGGRCAGGVPVRRAHDRRGG